MATTTSNMLRTICHLRSRRKWEALTVVDRTPGDRKSDVISEDGGKRGDSAAAGPYACSGVMSM